MKSWRTDPPGFAQVLQVWRRNRCVGEGTIEVYRYWICRFYDYCRVCKLDEGPELTEQGAARFARWWRSQGSPRRGHLASAIHSSRSALRSWAFARMSLGEALPPWRPVRKYPVPPALEAFAAYLSEVRGSPPQTIRKKVAHMVCLPPTAASIVVLGSTHSCRTLTTSSSSVDIDTHAPRSQISVRLCAAIFASFARRGVHVEIWRTRSCLRSFARASDHIGLCLGATFSGFSAQLTAPTRLDCATTRSCS